jgi:hypothetical protein
MKHLAAALLLVSAACSATRNDAVAPTGEVYGKALPAGKPIAAEVLLAEPAKFNGQRVILEGVVSDVCKVKGCWMVMAEGERKLRVTFENYGFFVPKDCAGRAVRVEGAFAIKEISVADAKHYLEDAGRHADAAKISEPVKELTLVASGVEFVDAKK